jgi:hypothetical protein
MDEHANANLQVVVVGAGLGKEEKIKPQSNRKRAKREL